VALFDRIGDLIVERFDAYDCWSRHRAATGHTLRLLRMPELVSAWITALSKRRRALLSLNKDIDRCASRRGDRPRRRSDPEDARRAPREARADPARASCSTTSPASCLSSSPNALPIEETARAAEISRVRT